MTEPAATANLRYTLTTTPEGLLPATADHARQGRLEITAGNPDSRSPATCRSITLTVPTDPSGAALTHYPERINTGYSGPGTWYIERNFADPGSAVFTFRPSNRRHEARFDGSAGLVLILDAIPLTTRSGDVELKISDETRSESGAYGFTSGEATVTVTISPAPAQQN
ncbi:hypothetical protein GXW83_24365 [Streptacidiphilus sp. PB12-B1b]|uniref:hypothetical protein n=1 Tax=Streptacidiphilus sp. PB12-B1b TaxID=2705012 RepID=UPI0015FBADF2|nr:hypothetical protein [Streptacidiphilus sp. PB12-B1b]QMU78375.1 hypothetical protein GXW83_24365 [Streptacidiphilus sp. PB12-B1b]